MHVINCKLNDGVEQNLGIKNGDFKWSCVQRDRSVYERGEIWTVFSSALIDLTGARIRENFKRRIFKLLCLSFEYPRGGKAPLWSPLFDSR